MSLIARLANNIVFSSKFISQVGFLVSKPVIDGYNIAIADGDITLTASGSECIYEEAEVDYYEWTLPDESKYQGDEITYHIPSDAVIDDVFVFSCIAIDTLGNRSDITFKGVKIVASLQYPIIDSFSWNDDNHEEEKTYDLTITAHDPQGQDLTYEVECDDGNVIVIQDGSNDNIFHVTYPDYEEDTNVTYTITVINEDLLDDNEVFIKLITNVLKSGDRGIFGGGYSNGYLDIIEYVEISTPGDAVDFGNLMSIKYYLSATSNGINDRGIFGGGYISGYSNVIEYITISTPGDAIDFGDLTLARYGLSSTSNGINDRGLFGGGNSGGYQDIIDYVTISTPGNATDFGDLYTPRYSLSSTSNGTNDRGLFGGGYSSGYRDIIDYVTVSILGDATDFGNLLVAKYSLTACSNGINDRGIFGGGYPSSQTIDYVTISTLGDAIDFGDLLVPRRFLSSTSNGINDRGVFSGGYDSGYSNVIEYVTISTLGDATDFGDLLIPRGYLAACSDG